MDLERDEIIEFERLADCLRPTTLLFIREKRQDLLLSLTQKHLSLLVTVYSGANARQIYPFHFEPSNDLFNHFVMVWQNPQFIAEASVD